MSKYIFIQNKKCESLKVSDGKAIQTPKNTGELIERNKNTSWQKESAVRNQLFVLPEYTYYVLPIWTLPLAIFVNFFSKSCPSLSKKYLCNFECSVERRRRFNINDRIKELGGLLPTQVTNDGQLGVQQLTIFCTTINNWVSNNALWAKQWK